jgi:regulator of protease activity HflC (stomatin/prohibitin superfamily)
VKIYSTFNPDWVKATATEAHRLGLHVHGHLPDRQIPLSISQFMQGPPAEAAQGFDLNSDPRLNAGFLLTGDSAVVHLQAQLYYQITDPAAYMVANQHVAPALQRLFIASAISTLAGRDLDSILVARPEIASRAGEASRRSMVAARVSAGNVRRSRR